MTTLELLNYGLIIGVGVLGWFARELWSAVKTLKEDLVALKEEVWLHYLRRDDFRDFRNEILSVLQRIENKLDTKQDK
jgi:hypothetical protein